MVCSLAPNMSSIGRMAQKHNTVSTTDMARRNTQALPRMRSAFALSPRPMAMEASGAPPMPARKEKDEMIRMMGKATPSPASASGPISGILPTKMRSTML